MKRCVLAWCLWCSLIAYANATEIEVVTEQWPPYNYTDNGKVTGVMTAVVQAVLAETDLQWEINVYPWARAYKMALMKPNVMIYTIFRLPERENKLRWIKINGLSTEMYLYRPYHRTDIQIESLEDAQRYRIGVTRETSTHHFLLSKGFVEGVNLFPVTHEIQNAFKSDPQRHHLDLTTGDRLSIAMWLKKYHFPLTYWENVLYLFKEDFYIAFSLQTDDAVVANVRKA